MKGFIDVVNRKSLDTVSVARKIALKGCSKALKENKRLTHWVLTSSPSAIDRDMFKDFLNLVSRLSKECSFEFFAVEARNEKEGSHLHIIIYGSIVPVEVLRNNWILSHLSDWVKVIPILGDGYEKETLEIHVKDICRYITMKHKDSFVRYGYSSDWIGGKFTDE